MFTPFVTDEKPVAIYRGRPPQYTAEGIALGCPLVLRVIKGNALINCNLQLIKEQPGSVVLFNAGDVIKVESRSEDYETEILAFGRFLHLAALNQLEDVNTEVFNNNFLMDKKEIAAAAESMVNIIDNALNVCTLRELYFVAVMQLRSFYMMFHSALRADGAAVAGFRNRADEIFYNFRRLLALHYRENRNVSFYAEKLCITTRYLTKIVQQIYHRPPKDAIDIFAIMQIKLDLLQTDDTLSELSYRYNFSSPSFFSDYFRRHVGCSPQEYRTQNRE